MDFWNTKQINEKKNEVAGINSPWAVQHSCQTAEKKILYA